MNVAPEIASRLAAKVASMTMQERGERAAEVVDTRSMREDDNLELPSSFADRMRVSKS